MTDEVTSVEEDDEPVVDPKEALAALALDEMKNRATTLGIKFHPSIGADTLAEKIKEFNVAEAARIAAEAAEKSAIPAPVITPLEPVPASRPINHAVAPTNREECEALVHVVVTCMDPLKKSFPGEPFSVGNAVVSTMTLYVPFGVEWHIPRILLNVLNEKYYTIVDRKKLPNGREQITTRQARAYAIQILPTLTKEEIEKLRQIQTLEDNARSD